MFHTYVRKFDVTGTVNFFKTKRACVVSPHGRVVVWVSKQKAKQLQPRGRLHWRERACGCAGTWIVHWGLRVQIQFYIVLIKKSASILYLTICSCAVVP